MLLSPAKSEGAKKVATARGSSQRDKTERDVSKGQSQTDSRFGHTRRFAALQVETANDSAEEEVLQFDALPSWSHVEPDTNGAIGEEEDTWDSPINKSGPVTSPNTWVALRLMPRFDSGFWTTYGNKLRVFGTREGVCPLAA